MRITLEMEVDPDEYGVDLDDVGLANLALAMLRGDTDWPEVVGIAVNGATMVESAWAGDWTIEEEIEE